MKPSQHILQAAIKTYQHLSHAPATFSQVELKGQVKALNPGVLFLNYLTGIRILSSDMALAVGRPPFSCAPTWSYLDWAWGHGKIANPPMWLGNAEVMGLEPGDLSAIETCCLPPDKIVSFDQFGYYENLCLLDKDMEACRQTTAEYFLQLATTIEQQIGMGNEFVVTNPEPEPTQEELQAAMAASQQGMANAALQQQQSLKAMEDIFFGEP